MTNLAVNNTSLHRKTPLMFAAEAGHTELVKLLVSKGASINYFSEADCGITALISAVMHVLNVLKQI